MKSIVFGLSLIGATVAQAVNGASMVPASYASASSSEPSGSPPAATYQSSSQPAYTSSPAYAASSGGYQSYSQPAYTSSPAYSAPPSQYTPPPASSMSAVYAQQQQGYSAFMNGGYKSMNCGYGYQKGSDGGCSAMSWVSVILRLQCNCLLTYPGSIQAPRVVTRPLSSTTLVGTVMVAAIHRPSPRHSIKPSPMLVLLS